MSYLSNFSLSESGKDIIVGGSNSFLFEKLASEAYLLCNVHKKEGPAIDVLEELIVFMLEELKRAANNGAEWFKKSINDGSISDNEYTRSFCTPEGYVEKEGAVDVLLQWSFSKNDGSDRMSWEDSPAYVRDLPDRFRPGLMMGAFSLYMLNSILEELKTGAEMTQTSLMDELGVVVDAVVAGKFNDGWACCEQMFEDDKKSNGQAGGKKRNQKYSQIREWVLKEYAAGSWPSPRAASFKIAPMAIEFSKNLGKPLSAQRAQITVYEWLLEEDKATHHHEGQESVSSSS